MTRRSRPWYHVDVMLTIAYHTLGCKVNQYETEKIRESLETAGFETVPFDSPADAYVINTCTVTAVADSKSRAAIRRAHRHNPEACVIVTGCCAQLEPDRIASIEGVDLLIPNDEKDTIPQRITARFEAAHRTNVSSGSPLLALRSPSKIRPRTRTRAVVKVQDGCDHFCSYCVVPYARPRKCSRPVGEVLAELKSLAGFGYKEIVLTGIRLGSYEDGAARLPELVRRASEIDGIHRIRLSSIEPWDVDDSLLDAMELPKVCRHLHLPLQSGDDQTLRLMNRPYDSAQYIGLIERVRSRINGVGITTDVMVGFPGESEHAFENTCALVDKVGFSRIHVFRYSPRRQTSAASMPDQVDARTKKLRADRMIEMGKGAMRRFAGSLISETAQVLVESRAGSSKVLTGLADNYVQVNFPVSGFGSADNRRAAPSAKSRNTGVSDASLEGEIVAVRVTGVNRDGVATGEMV